MKKTKEAMEWIVRILKKQKLPYRLSGGFAARIYGSKRKLADIDIDTTDKALLTIIPEVQDYILDGPKRYKDKEWDVFALELNYKGQEIGLVGVDSAKIFDKRKKKWIRFETDFSKVVKKKVYGQTVNVISKEDLIDYKEKIRRRVDLQDIIELA